MVIATIFKFGFRKQILFNACTFQQKTSHCPFKERSLFHGSDGFDQQLMQNFLVRLSMENTEWAFFESFVVAIRGHGAVQAPIIAGCSAGFQIARTGSPWRDLPNAKVFLANCGHDSNHIPTRSLNVALRLSLPTRPSAPAD